MHIAANNLYKKLELENIDVVVSSYTDRKAKIIDTIKQ